MKKEKLFSAVDGMPAFPKSVQRVVGMCSESGCNPRDLTEVIRHDPILTMKILKVVNSPHVGLRQKITSIQQAIVYLGLNMIKNIALSVAVIGTLPMENKAGFNMRNFWLHSLAVAVVSRKLAETQGVDRTEVEDYYSAGLLHDVGKVVFALYLPAEYREVMDRALKNVDGLYAAEREMLGADHAEIGALLAKRWELPAGLIESIGRHHEPDKGESSLMVDCVFIADQASKTFEYGFSGEFCIQPIPDLVRKRFPSDLDEVIASLPHLDEDLEKARIFIEV